MMTSSTTSPHAPGDDVLRLLVALGQALGVEEDADDHADGVFLAGVADVLQAVAVGAVHADGGEAELGDGFDVRVDFGRLLALAGFGVGGVDHRPLVCRWSWGCSHPRCLRAWVSSCLGSSCLGSSCLGSGT